MKLISFGFKHGAPAVPHYRLIDCRRMRNPHSVAELKPLSGKSPRVQQFVMNDPDFEKLMTQALSGVNDGDTVMFGCYGGHHRSVAMVQLAAQRLQKLKYKVEIEHRELAS